jgi:hypothetical protein
MSANKPSGGGMGSMLELMGKAGPLMSNMPPWMMTASSNLMANIIPPIKAYKIEEIKPRFRPDAKRIRLTYGPYKLKGLKVT